MRGDPVWLASVSKRSPLSGEITTTPRWTPDLYRRAEEILLSALDGAGDPGRERLFRMQITLCLHRALSPAEVLALPPHFRREDAAGLAGGPVEILRETVPGADSTRPCHNPTRQSIPGADRDPSLWVPLDCGLCPPCRARARLA